ncbi:Fumitremorgin C synthase, partial [Leucoagaricus sp. SymC.cos]
SMVFKTVLALFAGYILYEVLRWFRLRQIMPPGPLGLPCIGNKSQVPSYKPWRKFEEWNRKYGPVSSILLGSTPTIIIGKAQYAWELLEKRSETYSSRPRFIMASEILSENRRALMLPNSSELWKQWRKMLHNGFHVRRVSVYHQIQSLESKVLLKQLLKDPNNFDGYLKRLRFAASIVVAATYGRRVDSVDEWVVKENIASMDCKGLCLPGKYLVESWPWLLKLPRSLQWFRALPERRKKQDEYFLLHLLNDVRTRSKNGTCPDCLTSQALVDRDKGKMDMSDTHLAYAVSSPFGAGIDTTAGTISVFLVAMLNFPEVLRKAQEEIDRVVGSDRMPEFHDKDQLPYVLALINETLRWRPIPILGGTAHASTADDEFHGKFIPKGSTIYANMYGIMRDEELFPNPDLFLPERFLPSSSTSSSQHPRINLRDFDLPFGFGRRICPGMHLGLNSLFITISRVLWSFDLKPAKDGVLPDPNAFTNQFNSKPMPFECKFVPRSGKVTALIEAEWENIQSQLDNWHH